MKTTIIKTAAIILTAAAIFLGAANPGFAQDNAGDTQGFAQKIVAAIKAKDRNAVLALIHPKVVEFMNTYDKETFDLIIDDMVNTNIPDNIEFIIQSTDDEPSYDKATKSINIKDGKMYFPIPPVVFLYVITPEKVTIEENGVKKTVDAKRRILASAIANENNKLSIVFPIIITNDSLPKEPAATPEVKSPSN